MALTGAAAYGIYPHEVVLPEVVRTLNQAGIGNEHICMVLSPVHPVATVVRDAKIVNSAWGEHAVSAALIGWLSEFGAAVIPTVGFFIRSEAFFHALVIEQNFSALCGEARTLANLGFSENDARRLGRQLGDAGVMLYVACPDGATAEWVTELLRCAGAPEADSVERNETTLAPDSFGGSRNQNRIPHSNSVSYTPQEIPSLAVVAAQDLETSPVSCSSRT